MTDILRCPAERFLRILYTITLEAVSAVTISVTADKACVFSA